METCPVCNIGTLKPCGKDAFICNYCSLPRLGSDSVSKDAFAQEMDKLRSGTHFRKINQL